MGKKKFECEGGCEKMEIEGIVFGCDKCMKKSLLNLSKKQKELILSVLSIEFKSKK